MKYSVWNTGTRAYDYYEAPGGTATHAGAPPRASTRELGATPEQAAWPLPSAAVKVGAGEMPQGRIASSLAGDDSIFNIDLKQSVIYAAIGYLAWRLLR